MNDTHPLDARLRAAGIRRIQIARALGVDKATVTRWVQHRIPAERVIDFERVTGINRANLRPDLYARPLPSEDAA